MPFNIFDTLTNSPLSVFSSWLFPGNVQERGGGRRRRQAESRPGFPDGLYHIDWLVKYISYHIKPAQGHDSSLGRKLWVSQRLLENSWQDAALLLEPRKLKQSQWTCCMCCFHPRLQQHQESVDFFDLWAIKSSFKHDLFYSKPHPLSGEISPEKKFLWFPYYMWHMGTRQTENYLMMSSHYSDLFIMGKNLKQWVSCGSFFFFCHPAVFFKSDNILHQNIT